MFVSSSAISLPWGDYDRHQGGSRTRTHRRCEQHQEAVPGAPERRRGRRWLCPTEGAVPSLAPTHGRRMLTQAHVRNAPAGRSAKFWNRITHGLGRSWGRGTLFYDLISSPPIFLSRIHLVWSVISEHGRKDVSCRKVENVCLRHKNKLRN